MSDDGRLCLICLSGPDGVGKTTQARILVQHLNSQGVAARYQWLRFNHLFTLPLLGYMRIAGISKKEVTRDGNAIRRLDLSRSEWLRTLFHAATLIDMLIGSIVKIRIPAVFGRTIVCDRFVIDTIVDVAIAEGDTTFFQSATGTALMRLVPNRTMTVVMTDQPEVLMNRRAEIPSKAEISHKIDLYFAVAASIGIKPLDCHNRTIAEVSEMILERVDEATDDEFAG